MHSALLSILVAVGTATEFVALAIRTDSRNQGMIGVGESRFPSKSFFSLNEGSTAMMTTGHLHQSERSVLEFHVLIVCTANYCRSPIAEQLLRSKFED